MDAWYLPLKRWLSNEPVCVGIIVNLDTVRRSGLFRILKDDGIVSFTILGFALEFAP
jgi:hypothetical protein